MREFFWAVMSMVLALLLSVVSAPNLEVWARPEWLLLVLLYWTSVRPEYFGALLAIALGLLQDSIRGSFLGLHVLVYGLIACVVLTAYQRVRMFNVWQQMFGVLLLVALSQLIEQLAGWVHGMAFMDGWWLLPAPISMLLWPLLRWFLDSLRAGRNTL